MGVVLRLWYARVGTARVEGGLRGCLPVIGGLWRLGVSRRSGAGCVGRGSHSRGRGVGWFGDCIRDLSPARRQLPGQGKAGLVESRHRTERCWTKEGSLVLRFVVTLKAASIQQSAKLTVRGGGYVRGRRQRCGVR